MSFEPDSRFRFPGDPTDAVFVVLAADDASVTYAPEATLVRDATGAPVPPTIKMTMARPHLARMAEPAED